MYKIKLDEDEYIVYEAKRTFWNKVFNFNGLVLYIIFIILGPFVSQDSLFTIIIVEMAVFFVSFGQIHRLTARMLFTNKRLIFSRFYFFLPMHYVDLKEIETIEILTKGLRFQDDGGIAYKTVKNKSHIKEFIFDIYQPRKFTKELISYIKTLENNHFKDIIE